MLVSRLPTFFAVPVGHGWTKCSIILEIEFGQDAG
jgi:hypothetical protein